MFESVREGESVVASLIISHMFSSVVVLEVRYVITASEPTLLILIHMFLRVHKHSHAFIIERLRFDEVE